MNLITVVVLAFPLQTESKRASPPCSPAPLFPQLSALGPAPPPVSPEVPSLWEERRPCRRLPPSWYGSGKGERPPQPPAQHSLPVAACWARGGLGPSLCSGAPRTHPRSAALPLVPSAVFCSHSFARPFPLTTTINLHLLLNLSSYYPGLPRHDFVSYFRGVWWAEVWRDVYEGHQGVSHCTLENIPSAVKFPQKFALWPFCTFETRWKFPPALITAGGGVGEGLFIHSKLLLICEHWETLSGHSLGFKVWS